MLFRNLRAMSDWRWKNRNSTPKVFKDRTKLATSDPPYAVDPEYSKIPSREELAEQLNNFLKQKGITVSQRSTGKRKKKSDTEKNGLDSGEAIVWAKSKQSLNATLKILISNSIMKYHKYWQTKQWMFVVSISGIIANGDVYLTDPTKFKLISLKIQF